jgi:hypothetical protein
MFKAIINNTGLIACCVYSNFFAGQVELDLELDSNNSTQAPEQITSGQYIYRSIATNLETLRDSKVIHFYNQRGEDSENRIKELKNAFGARQMPCGDFNANSAIFQLYHGES